MKRILFRADAKPSIGIGDLISLISLSKYFIKAGWKIYFMIRGYEAGVKIAQKYRLSNLITIDPQCSLDEEVRAINSICSKECIDLVFFEITERSLSDYKGLKDTFKKAAISFDGNLLDDLSLVVSWVPDSTKLFNPNKYPKTKFLLGYEYVTLSPEFFDDPRIKIRQYNPNPRKILVAMGGADENNLTKKVVDALIINKIYLQTTIITGGGYEFLEKLENNLELSGLNYQLKNNIINMLEEYLDCDIAIGSGGLTASELVASRTPAILIAAYEHQIDRCKFFQSKGWGQYLGYRDFDLNKFTENIFHPPSVALFNPFKNEKIMLTIQSIL